MEVKKGIECGEPIAGTEASIDAIRFAVRWNGHLVVCAGMRPAENDRGPGIPVPPATPTDKR